MAAKTINAPVILPQIPEIGVSQAARILGVHPSTARRMCENGEFETAHKPTGKRGWWKIARLEAVKKKHITSLEYAL